MSKNFIYLTNLIAVLTFSTTTFAAHMSKPIMAETPITQTNPPSSMNLYAIKQLVQTALPTKQVYLMRSNLTSAQKRILRKSFPHREVNYDRLPARVELDMRNMPV